MYDSEYQIAITAVDRWLDANCSEDYKSQPLAQDWARVSKMIEELGEAISEIILFTGQNPRKPRDLTARARMLKEIADFDAWAMNKLQVIAAINSPGDSFEIGE